jgi:glycosyltransferase involved in cell wall biosynthesis
VASFSVVIPAFNAEHRLGAVLEALREQSRPPDEIIVVDDRSTDRTAAVAESFGARVVTTTQPGYAGGARNRGWDVATGDVVVFVDDDIIAAPGWGEGLERAVHEFPNAVIGCALMFEPVSSWDWVGHLQTMTPYLPRGVPRDLGALCSGCLAVPREAPLRWDESYGGEDGVFSVDALAAGLRLVFDPRFGVEHRAHRVTFSQLRGQQRRIAYGLARCAPIQREGRHKHIVARVPAYFALVRIPLIYRRLRSDRRMRSAFLRCLPHMIVGEWAMGIDAVRYALRPPPLVGETGDFRHDVVPAAD